MHKHPSRGAIRKSCFENLQQIYRRTPISECDFNKVALQLYWNYALGWVFLYAYVLLYLRACALGVLACLACLHAHVLCLSAYVLGVLVCSICFTFEKLNSKNFYIEKLVFIQRSIKNSLGHLWWSIFRKNQRLKGSN